MKVSRQPRISDFLRLFAGTCALLWLVGIAVWGMEGICNCASHEGACAANANPVHKHDAVFPPEQVRSHDAEMHQHATASHDHDGAAPQPCDDKNGCRCSCSTIQALITTITPIVIPKTVSQPVFNMSLLCAAAQQEFAAPPSETLRRAKPRDWVFTPEVCLGPAFHSLAPPVFI